MRCSADDNRHLRSVLISTDVMCVQSWGEQMCCKSSIDECRCDVIPLLMSTDVL